MAFSSGWKSGGEDWRGASRTLPDGLGFAFLLVRSLCALKCPGSFASMPNTVLRFNWSFIPGVEADQRISGPAADQNQWTSVSADQRISAADQGIMQRISRPMDQMQRVSGSAAVRRISGPVSAYLTKCHRQRLEGIRTGISRKKAVLPPWLVRTARFRWVRLLSSSQTHRTPAGTFLVPRVHPGRSRVSANLH